MRYCRQLLKSSESGAAMVEVALVLPLFVLLSAFLFNLALSVREQSQLVALARDTARRIAAAPEDQHNDADIDIIFAAAANALAMDPGRYVFSAQDDEVTAATNRILRFYRVTISRPAAASMFSNMFRHQARADISFAVEPPAGLFM